ncbi:MAG: bifunctional DNA-formamidopyrimidine glycosylase/DNA-(apurinic or apyrimidinic site) lyase [Gammaproteobacteria bacterium]|nr:bifunctional DNA-formamidopyrimidine glycosylase/DNA-(apurinic or apyrimidinic site) lyase [Gammaproteobacteria bacterium]
MPELPEVETTCRGIKPHLCGQRVTEVVIRNARLRWPVPPRLKQQLVGETVSDITRRGKYLLLHTAGGTVILHLGMSGSLRLVDAAQPAEKHDHVDLVFEKGHILRLRDPRRFGAVLWTRRPPQEHRLLVSLGPEPLQDVFTGAHLHQRSRQRKLAVKSFIMDSKIVVGVGNIYANESLFLAGIRPTTAAGRISRARFETLATVIKQVLEQAIAAGGTTLRDFTNGAGQPGYFQQQLRVYGRAGDPCPQCQTPIRLVQQMQRATYYCPQCQAR